LLIFFFIDYTRTHISSAGMIQPALAEVIKKSDNTARGVVQKQKRLITIKIWGFSLLKINWEQA
jgi:hypothetical protein